MFRSFEIRTLISVIDGLHRVKLNDMIFFGRFCSVIRQKEDTNVVFSVIGIGNMGQALVGGFLRKGLLKPDQIRIYDLDQDKMKIFAQKTGCVACASAVEAIDHADYILIAVKPQVFDRTVDSFSHKLPGDTVIISIAASVSVSRIIHLVHKGNPIVRVMPNTPALVGAGVSAICFDGVAPEQELFVLNLFKTCGLVVPCDEKTLDAIGCVSATGPAYVMVFIEAMADAAVRLGITRKAAYEIAAMTVMGSGRMMLETGMHPAVLKDQVCSPGGTTIEGVVALEKFGLRTAVEEAIFASDSKSKKMSGGDA